MTFSDIVVFIYLLYLFISTLYNHSPLLCFSQFLQWYHRQPAIPSLLLFHSSMVPFYFVWSWSYSILCIHISKFFSRSFNNRKKCILSFLVRVTWFNMILYSSIHLPARSYFTFIYIWIIFQSLYVPHFYYPHFYYPFISWKTCRLFPFPAYCEQSGNEPGWARIWRMLLSHLDICQGMA